MTESDIVETYRKSRESSREIYESHPVGVGRQAAGKGATAAFGALLLLLVKKLLGADRGDASPRDGDPYLDFLRDACDVDLLEPAPLCSRSALCVAQRLEASHHSRVFERVIAPQLRTHAAFRGLERWHYLGARRLIETRGIQLNDEASGPVDALQALVPAADLLNYARAGARQRRDDGPRFASVVFGEKNVSLWDVSSPSRDRSSVF